MFVPSLVLLLMIAGVPLPGIVPAVDRLVRFTVADTITYGTVHVPAHRTGGRLPAALLLPGSGPTDRNGNQLPSFAPNTMAQIAAALGRVGVMSLRFDKYGSGQTGLGTYREHQETLDYPAVVAQAVAAYGMLRDQPEADGADLYVVGHSEGGLTALFVAARGRPGPAGIALLAPQSLRILDHLREQLLRQLAWAVRSGQLTVERQRLIGAALLLAIAELRAHRTVDATTLPAEIAPSFSALQGINRRYVDSDDAVYPPDVVRHLPTGTRVLVTCGTADIQITCTDTVPLAAAMGADRTGRDRVVLAGVDHFLALTDYPYVVAPAVLDALDQFLRARRNGAINIARIRTAPAWHVTSPNSWTR